MTGPREEMACATCLAPLNVLDGDYIHPLQRDNDGHPPVLVPVTQLDTVDRTCDFCGDSHPMWTVRGGSVKVLATGSQTDLLQDMGETWAACLACMADIDSGKAHRVVDRAVRRMGMHDIPFAHTQTSRLHQAFLADRQPGRVLITTTAWPDVTLSPRDLPKVRDRLATFYRGPDELPATLRLTQMRGQVADSLDRARLYWIDGSFTELAEHAASQMPAVTASRDLAPCDDGLLVWTRSATARRIMAVSWATRDDVIHVVVYRAIGTGLDDQPMQHLRDEVGWLAPMRTFQLRHDQLVDDAHDHGSTILLATWLLIAQKAAETVPADIDKTVRKRYARAKRPLPDVRIVRIRAHTQREDTATPTGTGRTYTSRVWVTGHWRNQAHGPGRTLRRPVYIHPFLRGPEDAPIKLSTTVRILDHRNSDKPERDASA
jgi:hypothetical protein